MRRCLILGGAGFIGSHLARRLKEEGNWVRSVDIKMPEFSSTDEVDEFYLTDLRDISQAHKAFDGQIDDVYQLAANMGGIFWITNHLAEIASDNVIINANCLDAARVFKVKRYLYTSSACVYNQNLQGETEAIPLKEEDAIPALPEDGYGWEKLFSEKMCEWYCKDYGLDVRIVRFHNCYGSRGSWTGGREKSPAALCRKIATAIKNGDSGIEIWGDGKQTRTYMFIDDCIEGIRRIMESGYQKPINLGYR